MEDEKQQLGLLERAAEESTIMDIVSVVCSSASGELRKQFYRAVITKLWDEFMADINKIMEARVNAVSISLPNASNKKEYDATIPFNVEGVTECWIEGLDEIGLSCTRKQNVLHLTGVPKKAGTFSLTIRYKYDGCNETTIPSRKVDLIINPDPRDLWVNIPVDWDSMPEPKYRKVDSEKQYIAVSALPNGEAQKDIVAASKRGRSHAKDAKPRDDHFRLFHSQETNWYVIAVADGAGSAKYSREGSRIACDKAVDYCIEQLSNNVILEENIKRYYEVMSKTGEAEARKTVGDDLYRILPNAALEANKAINAEAERTKNSVKDYATTFLLAVCKKFEFGWFVAGFWIGDGAICIYDNKSESHTIKLLGTPDVGEYAGQTKFLTMPEILTDAKSVYQRLRFWVVPDFTALFLMTDGVSDPMFKSDADLNSVSMWDNLWDKLLHDEKHPVALDDDNEESAQQLLDWLDFWVPGENDDRTLAILY